MLRWSIVLENIIERFNQKTDFKEWKLCIINKQQE